MKFAEQYKDWNGEDSDDDLDSFSCDLIKSDSESESEDESLRAKPNLTADQVLDELEHIFGQTMMSIDLAELWECDDIMDEVNDLRNEQKVILLNSQDSSYWCFSNITDFMDITFITSDLLLSLLRRS